MSVPCSCLLCACPMTHASYVDSCVLCVVSGLVKSVLSCEIILMHADAVLRQQGRKVHAGYTDDLPAAWARPRKPWQLAVTASQQHRCHELQHPKAHVLANTAYQPSARFKMLLGVLSTFQWPSTGFKMLPGVFAPY